MSQFLSCGLPHPRDSQLASVYLCPSATPYRFSHDSHTRISRIKQKNRKLRNKKRKAKMSTTLTRSYRSVLREINKSVRPSLAVSLLSPSFDLDLPKTNTYPSRRFNPHTTETKRSSSCSATYMRRRRAQVARVRRWMRRRVGLGGI